MTTILPMDQYLEGMTLLDEEIGKAVLKSSTLAKLTDVIVCDKISPERNKALKAFTLTKSIRSSLAKVEKSLKEVQKLQQNVILGMLETEQLDNYSHDGKLFYPSSTTRFNVSDRVTLEKFVLSQGPEGLQLMGNTLNSEFIKNYMEKHTTVDEKGEEIPSPLPAGVGTFTSLTLNMRNK